MRIKLILFFSLISTVAFGQHLVSKHFYQTFTHSKIDSAYASFGLPSFILPNNYEVDVYHILYNTVMPDSVTPTVASGLFIVPKNKTCASTILSYQHGTQMTKAEAPSKRGGMEWIIGLAMAEDGYVAVLPDYIGLGYDVVNRHPYQHARSEATATLDMIRASREACADLNVDLNGQVLLAGYSQGGHATMAAHKMIQHSFPNEFNIGGSVPMSGPYSMSGVMKDVILQTTPYPAPYYLPYVLLSFQDIYQPYNSVDDFLKTPYNTTLPPLYDGYNGAGTVNAAMPNVPRNIIKDQLLDSVDIDSNHIFNQILRDNDVYKWVPNKPVHMLYCGSDTYVPKENAFVAYNYMSSFGAPVAISNVSDDYEHTPCAQFAMLQMKAIIDTLRSDKISGRFSEVKPTIGQANGSLTIHALGVEQPYSILWSTGDTTATINNLPEGGYNVTITSSNACNTFTAGWFLNAATNVSVEDIEQGDFILYPNPGNGVFQLESKLEIERIDVYTITGKRIFMKESSGTNITIDLSMYGTGVYYVVVNNQIPLRYLKR